MFTATLGYICRITVNFGTLKDGSLSINIFASSNCFSDRNIFQNGVDALSKIDDAFVTKSWTFHLVRIIRLCSNFASLLYKPLLWNYKRNFRLPMSAFATVTGNTLLENQFFLHGYFCSCSFMFPLLLLTVFVQNTICNSLLTLFITS